MFYQTRAGDSPAIIARRFGVSVGSLVNANAHKPTTTVAGKHTWRSLHQGEKLRVPIGVGDGFLGVVPASPGGSHPQVKRYAGSPPDQVALVQSRLGLSTDGIFGAGTESAVKAFQASNGLAADGIVGPGTWSKLLGGAVTTTAPTAASAPAAASNSLSVAATAAIAAAAIAADPSYCTSVARSGTPVNSAVHNFKAAWNSANPGQAVPINTGKYEPVVASALSSALGGLPVPPGCGGAPAPVFAPSVSIPSVTPVSLPSMPSATSIPAAVQAMASVDPCYSENAPMVCAMQSALGLPADGKYGPGTAAALRRFLPNAPAGCVGPPLWWGKTTDNKCGGAMPALPSMPTVLPSLPAALPSLPSLPALPASSTSTSAGWQASAPSMPQAAAAPAASAQPGATTVTATVGPSQPAVTAPTDQKISTGAMVAGGLGLAALVGVVAVAAGGKRTTTKTSTTTRRAPTKSKPTKSKKRK